MSIDNMVMVFRLGQLDGFNYAIISEVTYPMLETVQNDPENLMDFCAKSNMPCIFCQYETDAELHDVACKAYLTILEKSEYGIEYGLRFTNWTAPTLLESLQKSAMRNQEVSKG